MKKMSTRAKILVNHCWKSTSNKCKTCKPNWKIRISCSNS